MEKHKPHDALKAIKAAFSDPDKLNRTMTSKQGADELGMDDTVVVGVIQALAFKDFDKSMTSNADHTVWQDVYRAFLLGPSVAHFATGQWLAVVRSTSSSRSTLKRRFC